MLTIKSMQDHKNKKGNMIFHSVSLENGNYTTIQNSILFNVNLSDKSVRVFALILMHRFNPSFQMNNFFLATALNCELKTIQRACKELKAFGYLDIYPTGEMRGNSPVYEYEIFEDPSQNLKVADKGSGQRQRTKPADKNVLHNNNISNNINNKISKLEETNQLSDLENVENIIIEFADKADEEQIKKALDDLLDGRLEIKLNSIEQLIKKVSDFRKVRPVDRTVELIKLLPEFVKASKLKNTDKVYEDQQSLNYLVKILENPLGNYPKWFLDSQKQEVIQKQVNDLEDSWKQTTSIWKAQGRRIDDSIKIMISTILNFIQDSEYHKQNNLEYTNIRYLEFFNESIIKTLKKKSVDEMIEIIKDYTSRQFNSLEPFKKVSDSFFNAGLDFETIKLYFENVKG